MVYVALDGGPGGKQMYARSPVCLKTQCSHYFTSRQGECNTRYGCDRGCEYIFQRYVVVVFFF
jgi:hypothetical protein